MDPADEAFEAALVAQRDSRRRRFDRTVALLRELGLPIDAQVAALESVTTMPLADRHRPRADGRRIRTTVEDAFSRIIGHGMPGYIRREASGRRRRSRLSAAAGGIPVLAHFREAATGST